MFRRIQHRSLISPGGQVHRRYSCPSVVKRGERKGVSVHDFTALPNPSRWLKHLLQQSTSTLQTTILHCSQSDEELISRCRATKNKLDALQQRTITTTLQLRSQVRHEMKNLCREIAKILQKEDVKRELLDWSSAPYPSAPALGSGEVSAVKSCWCFAASGSVTTGASVGPCLS